MPRRELMMSSAAAPESASIHPSRFAQWNRDFAQILRFMESAPQRVATAMIDALRSLTPNSVGAIWVFQTGSAPGLVYIETGQRSDEQLQLEQEYKLGMYTVDPIFHAFKEGFTGCASIYELMPRGFERSEYWSRFYASVDVVDQLVHFVPQSDGRSVQMALSRTAEFGRFSESELANQRAVYPALAAAVCQFDPFSAPSKHVDLAVRIEAGLACFGADVLTQREREVVSLVIHGHNTPSIAQQLDLSPDTIRLHRHNAYAKLHVNTQGELFYRFLESLR